MRETEFNEVKPGALAIAEDVTTKRMRLDAKNIILTDDPSDVASYLPTYCHTMTELIELGPWGCYETFRTTVGKDLPRLFLSEKAKAVCAEELASLTDPQRRANYLFSYEDAADWLQKNMQTDVMSVVIPLSMFSTDADAFRAQFLAERRMRFQKLADGNASGGLKTKIYRWNLVNSLPQDIQKQIGHWKQDYNDEKVRQGLTCPNPTALTVPFPPKVLARYKSHEKIELTKARSRNTILYEGLAVHREQEHVHVGCRRHYTPGLLLGDEKNWPDYELGLVDVMSIPRAVALLGEDYLKNCPWRLHDEDVVWAADKSVIHNVSLNREFRILLGLHNGR